MTCSECPKKYMRADHLNLHIAKMHSDIEKPYRNPYTGTPMTKKEALREARSAAQKSTPPPTAPAPPIVPTPVVIPVIDCRSSSDDDADSSSDMDVDEPPSPPSPQSEKEKSRARLKSSVKRDRRLRDLEERDEDFVPVSL